MAITVHNDPLGRGVTIETPTAHVTIAWDDVGAVIGQLTGLAIAHAIVGATEADNRRRLDQQQARRSTV